jgi:hypothetical protein
MYFWNDLQQVQSTDLKARYLESIWEKEKQRGLNKIAKIG